jgi:hypothetical protein
MFARLLRSKRQLDSESELWAAAAELFPESAGAESAVRASTTPELLPAVNGKSPLNEHGAGGQTSRAVFF